MKRNATKNSVAGCLVALLRFAVVLVGLGYMIFK